MWIQWRTACARLTLRPLRLLRSADSCGRRGASAGRPLRPARAAARRPAAAQPGVLAVGAAVVTVGGASSTRGSAGDGGSAGGSVAFGSVASLTRGTLHRTRRRSVDDGL